MKRGGGEELDLLFDVSNKLHEKAKARIAHVGVQDPIIKKGARFLSTSEES